MSSPSLVAEGTATAVAAVPASPPQPRNTSTGPVPDGPPVTVPKWVKEQPATPPTNEQKPPKLGAKVKHLAPLFESHPIKLQWIMQRNTKSMLDLHEKIVRKTESLSRAANAHYSDAHDRDAEGKAKKKPFVHTSLRIKPLLSCSETVRNDGRVADVYTQILMYQQNGIRMLDEFKQKLTEEVDKITREEIKALRRICAYEYYEVAFNLAGIILLDRAGGKHPPPQTDIRMLAHATVGEHFVLDEEPDSEEQQQLNERMGDHLSHLPFTLREGDNVARGIDAFKAYRQESHLDKWEEKYKTQVAEEDHDLIAEAGFQLFDTMTKLTTELWATLDKKKADSEVAGMKEEFLGLNMVDSANQKLDEAMEIDDSEDKKIGAIIDKRINARLNKQKSQEKKEKRKNSSAGGKDHPPASKNNGQNGKGGAAAGTRKPRSKSEKNSQNRGRSPKRSPPRDHSADSYNSKGRERGKSRPRYEDKDNRDKSRPRSILKKKVRFPQGKGKERERGNQRGKRGGRGEAPSASKRGNGERS